MYFYIYMNIYIYTSHARGHRADCQGDSEGEDYARVRTLTPYTLRPKPYTLHPAPYALRPSPYTIIPT